MELAYSLTFEVTMFIIVTTGFFVLKAYFLSSYGPEDPTNKMSFGLATIYVAVIIIVQFIFNLSNAAQICSYTNVSGETIAPPQAFGTVLMYTLIPNFFILGSVVALISIFPGWLSPFSNTFGYFFVSCLGLKQLFNSMVKSKSSNPLLEQICADQSLIINEMTPDNYEDFMKTLCKKNGIIEGDKVPDCSNAKPGAGTDENKRAHFATYYNLYKFVMWKNIIAEYIWYLLAGGLTLSIGSNAVINMSCEYSAKDLKQIADSESLRQQNEAEDRSANKPALFEPS